jgi:hypothetical protein
MNGNRNGNTMKIEMVICKEINNNCKQESWNIPDALRMKRIIKLLNLIEVKVSFLDA